MSDALAVDTSVTPLAKLVQYATIKSLELRIHINPQIAEDMNLFEFLGKLKKDNEISNEVAGECIKCNLLISILFFPKNDDEQYCYAHGTDVNNLAQSIITETGIK